jgi:type IV pilus assembly protein PilO
MAITANDIKKLSPQAKALIVIVVILGIGYLYYFYFLSDLFTKKAKLEKENQDIQVQIKQKEKVAVELNKYKGEVDTLIDSYKVALLKLPDQREIPGLFHSVSLAGKDAGI